MKAQKTIFILDSSFILRIMVMRSRLKGNSKVAWKRFQKAKCRYEKQPTYQICLKIKVFNHYVSPAII